MHMMNDQDIKQVITTFTMLTVVRHSPMSLVILPRLVLQVSICSPSDLIARSFKKITRHLLTSACQNLLDIAKIVTVKAFVFITRHICDRDNVFAKKDT